VDIGMTTLSGGIGDSGQALLDELLGGGLPTRESGGEFRQRHHHTGSK
jgi:hypothetical protein